MEGSRHAASASHGRFARRMLPRPNVVSCRTRRSIEPRVARRFFVLDHRDGSSQLHAISPAERGAFPPFAHPLTPEGISVEQRIAVLATVTLVAIVLGIFATIARSAAVAGNADEVATAAARWRRNTFWILVVLSVPAIAVSLTRLPYAGADDAQTIVIKATGHQWSWDIGSSNLLVGQTAAIQVTGADVNHGFGLYDPSNRLVAQTQAMPGYVNVLHYTFTTPGTYRVLCLEYCGLGHHTMMAQLDVAPATPAN